MEPTSPAALPVAPAPELADEEVARRVVAGETTLFELLLRRHNQRLFRIARGVVDSDAEAEDVLQDAWVRAYEHLADFRGEARLTTWLSKIVLHEGFARRRRGRRLVALDGGRGEEGAMIEPESPAPGPEQLAWTAELRVALERAVAAMPPHYRSVFLMREIEGLSTAETAACLELSSEAVKVRLHRARARLRDDLERSLGAAARGAFGFAAERCDRIVAAVLARVAAL